MLIIGLMSGTSADGINAALVDIHGSGTRLKAELIGFQCTPHDPAVRSAILELCEPSRGRIPDLCALSAVLGEKFADAARSVAESSGTSIDHIAAIGSHGQTIWHQPEPRDLRGISGRGTLQIANPAVIAAQTGCRVVSDFRSADMAAGGQGAPLVPFADWALLGSDRESRAVQNIGGIANVTFLRRGAEMSDILAFDTGPGNMVIDFVVRELSGGEKEFDRNGAWAARGNVGAQLLERLLANPYFGQSPPKTTGRELFGGAYGRRVIRYAREKQIADSDLMATVTALTAESTARAFETWIKPLGGVKTVILGGGGAHNRTLVAMLSERLKPARITNHEEFGIPGDAKEAIAFALLAYETLQGRPSNVPSATGAAYPAVLGSITPPPR